MKRPAHNGFTLIEAVLGIMIVAISFLGLSYVLSRTILQNGSIDAAQTSTFLARDKLAEVTAQDFSAIGSSATTAFPSPFAGYSHNVGVGYVNAANLDTVVPGPTEYKRIVVTVTAAGWSTNIQLYGLRTNFQ